MIDGRAAPASGRRAGGFRSPAARRGGVLLLLSALLALAAPSARAQMMHLDPLPFFTPADSTSRLALVVDYQRTTDPKWDWSSDRLLLTAVLPAGDDGTFFLRLPFVTFDSGDIPIGRRWPWVLGEGAVDGWPNEKRLSGFGKFEMGVTGPVVLPLVRGVDYGLALGLPTSADRLYPLSAQSIPFRIELRKPVALGGGFQAGFRAGYLLHMNSGRDYLDAFAFPDGYRLGATLARYGRRGSRWELSWNYRNEDSRESQVVGIRLWFPWTADGSVGVKVDREIAGSLDRYAEWRFGLAWRLDSPRYRRGVEPEREVRD